MRLLLSFLTCLALLACGTTSAADWPHWRGAHRDDVVQEDSGWHGGQWLKENPVWQAAVGEGATSPLVVGGRLYVLGWKKDQDHVVCLDAQTGQSIWEVSYRCPRYGRFATGDQELYAGSTSTPEYDAGSQYLYTLSCDGDLNCWNTSADGKKVWGLNLYDSFPVERRPASKLEGDNPRDYGYTTAPLVRGSWVIVEVGSSAGSVMAFDKRTGERRWASQYRSPAGHTGGLVPITVEGIPCLAVLTFSDLLVLRLDPGNEGKTVATYPWKTAWANNNLTPTVKGDCLLISAAHTHKSICKLQITLRGARRLWEQPFYSFVGSPVIDGNRIYLAGQRLFCLDWDTGKLVWSGGSYGYGGACMVARDGKVIAWSNLGRATLIASARESPKEYKPLGRSPHMFQGAEAWPHPVLANARLFCKDRKGNLKCFAVTRGPDS